MKKFFSAIVAMMLAAPAFAQFSSGGFELDKQNLYYGVRLGMTVADLSGDLAELGDLDTDAKVGMTLGGVVGLRVSQSTPLFLESGLYYTERGAKDVGYSNLEIPLLIKYGIKATDDIAILPFVGPYFARACWGKTKQPKADGTGSEKVGTFDTELVEEFWLGFVRNAGITLHIRQLAGKNSHHIIEGTFKSAARSLRQAAAIEKEFAGEIPSTKGLL